MKTNPLFWKKKRVFITGHTGFKGAWLCRVLMNLGAHLTGYALPPDKEPNLFAIAGLDARVTSIYRDIRDAAGVHDALQQTQPDIVFHLAAQPLVQDGYSNPRYTYETNVMGTVNIMESVRHTASVKSFLNVTTDKVYLNREWEWGYRENEPLDGSDPYSNSKSCSELVTHCYIESFLRNQNVAVSTARAGNVIGGGDFSLNRIIPDCVRAAQHSSKIIVRHPRSVRPYQHVLEPLTAYMLIAEQQYKNIDLAGYYNVGPDEHDSITTQELAELFCQEWGNGLSWIHVPDDTAPHEARLLKLDCSKLKNVFGWSARWTIQEAIAKTVEWTKIYFSKGNIPACMDYQISDYFAYPKIALDAADIKYISAQTLLPLTEKDEMGINEMV